MVTTYKNPRKIKLILLATIFITLGTTIAVYISSRPDKKEVQHFEQAAEPDATLSIDKIQQTATRDGKKEWSLEASSGHYIDKNSLLVLVDVKVTFFLKDESELFLTADKGILKTKSSDIDVSGNVVLENKQYRLLTDTLSYVHRKRVVFSKTPVKISGATTQVVADSLRFDLDAKKLTLDGGVATTINEDVTL